MSNSVDENVKVEELNPNNDSNTPQTSWRTLLISTAFGRFFHTGELYRRRDKITTSDCPFAIDNPPAFLYNIGREENRRSRGQAERPVMRKVRAPQGKDNG